MCVCMLTCTLTACSCFLFMLLMYQATPVMVSMASWTTSYPSSSGSKCLAISFKTISVGQHCIHPVITQKYPDVIQCPSCLWTSDCQTHTAAPVYMYRFRMTYHTLDWDMHTVQFQTVLLLHLMVTYSSYSYFRSVLVIQKLFVIVIPKQTLFGSLVNIFWIKLRRCCTWSSRWYFSILCTGLSRKEPRGREHFRSAWRSRKNFANVLLLMQSVRAATELEERKDKRLDRSSGVTLQMLESLLLGVVGAILGVNFKVFTLGKQQDTHL